MSRKRLAVILVSMLALTGWVGSAWSADLKIACVDIQKAMNECQAGKEAKKSIAREMEKLQRLSGEKQKELQTLKESLEKQAPMLTPEARVSKERDYQGKLRDYQRWGEDSQKEIQQKGLELERNILQGVQKVIKKLGEDEGYTLVLEKNESIVLFASKTIDVTDRVIKVFDAQKK
jgi:outer membrane protein